MYLMQGQLECDSDTVFELAAYVLQAVHGDFVEYVFILFLHHSTLLPHLGSAVACWCMSHFDDINSNYHKNYNIFKMIRCSSAESQ